MSNKLFFCFTVLIFCCFSCEEEAKNSSSSSMDYRFTIKLNGDTHTIQGNTSTNVPITGAGSNVCYAVNTIGTDVIQLAINDVSASNYINGQNLSLSIDFPNLLLGNSLANVSFMNLDANSYISSFFNSIGAVPSYQISSTSVSSISNITPLNFNITDLGTPTVQNTNPSSINLNDIFDWGETLKGNFNGTVYARSSTGNEYNVPFLLEIDFEVIRYLY
tara:strand:- start:275 stop:931 length:657 start_codon:yes stop_codon:yes gene_type:complete